MSVTLKVIIYVFTLRRKRGIELPHVKKCFVLGEIHTVHGGVQKNQINKLKID